MGKLLGYGILLSAWIGSVGAQATPLGPEMVEDVRIEAGTTAQDGKYWFEDEGQNASPRDRIPDGDLAGQGLLRFFGCATCHAIPETAAPRWLGPRLDRTGEKLYEDWLKAWLLDPAALRPLTKMPRIPLDDLESELLVRFLMQRRSAVPAVASSPGDPDAGRLLFDEMSCLDCHDFRGEGEMEGGTLDRTEERLRAPWLAAFLEDPDGVQPGTEMVNYDFTSQQAVDLAAFLTIGAKDVAMSLPDEKVPALDLFVQRGCAGCHLLGESQALEITADTEKEALERIAYHRMDGQEQSASFRIEISDSQARAMAQALRPQEPSPSPDQDFDLADFWATPVPLQGWAPEAYDGEAGAISPEDCGACHERQFEDWGATLHSLAMGPGVFGQLVEPGVDPAFIVTCQKCHAPLAEQHSVLPEGDGFGANYQFDRKLRASGVGCAVCHVRGHLRFGPPPGEKSGASVWRGMGHGGAIAVRDFERSEFCSHCHQFEPGQQALEGKLLQDTYEEWKRSPQAAEGETCQSCHMPDRRHLFRGIHDRETVLEAIDVTMTRLPEGPLEIRLRNRGAGHHLPTYVTPKLFVEARLLDADLESITGSSAMRAVGREIVLNPGEFREVFDTRIPAGGEWIWEYSPDSLDGAEHLEVRIDVHPDHFYLGFFEDYSREGLGDEARTLLDRAEAHNRASPYLLLRERWSLARSGDGDLSSGDRFPGEGSP